MKCCARFPFAPITLPLLATLCALASHRSAHADDDGELARQARPEIILRVALAQSPDLKEERARTAVAAARTSQAARLPDLRLKYEQWGVPLRQPLALGKADTLMLGVSQALPTFAALDGQRRVAAEEEQAAVAVEAGRRRDLRAQVRRAFADYYRANRQLQLHREHVQFTARLVDLARASYRSGHRGQQDVLRLSLELSRLHGDVAHIEQEEGSARALLNALMNRPSDAPLGPPAEIEPIASEAPVAVSMDTLDGRRSEVAAARAAVRRSEAALDLTRNEARWPSFMIGLDYWYMPMAVESHAYGAMVSVNLPWFSPARQDAVRAGEQSVIAERHALESVRNAIRYEASDAAAKYEAARATFVIVDSDLMIQAQRNYEAAQAGYAAGQGDAVGLVDALRSYLEVRLDRVRALVHLETTAADLERATGRGEGVR